MEIWKDIEGFEGRYRVSSDGRVESAKRRTPKPHGKGSREIPQRVLKPIKWGNGYLAVNLYDEYSKPHVRMIHRLVAEAYIPNPLRHPNVLHWDDNRENNDVSNLRWGTPGDNTQDLIRNKGMHNSNKTHCPKGHEYDEENTVEEKSPKGGVWRKCRKCKKSAAIQGRKKRGGMTPPKHGTSYIYREYNCRCGECTRAYEVETRRNNSRRKGVARTCKTCGGKYPVSNLSRHEKTCTGVTCAQMGLREDEIRGVLIRGLRVDSPERKELL